MKLTPEIIHGIFSNVVGISVALNSYYFRPTPPPPPSQGLEDGVVSKMVTRQRKCQAEKL